MPTIPTFNRQVEATNLPGVRLNSSVDTGAGEIAAGLSKVAGAVAGYAQREREKQDTAALMAAERELQDWQNQALFNPETGAFQQKGKAAFDLPDRLMPEWDRRVGDVESRLNARQKAVFRERAGSMRVSMERDLFRHVGSEAESFQKAETGALVTTRLETALLYWNDPARFDKELREAQGVFLAGNDGLPPAAQRVGLMAIESKARNAVVQKMVETSPLAAQRYFDTYRDKMTAADAAESERLLKPAILDARAETEVDRALGMDVSEGEPADYESYRRKLESVGSADPNTAKNPNSTALGPDQFTAPTWIEVVKQAKPAWAQGLSEQQILALRTDPTKSAEMARALDQRNAAALTRAGVPVSNQTLYAAHHFGDKAAIRFAKADADTPMAEILSAEQMRANGYLRGKTKADTLANWAARAGGTRTPLAAPASKAEALARLNDLADPEVRKAAIAKYKTRLDIEEFAKAERTEQMTESINTKVEEAAPGTNLRQVLSPAEYAWAAENGKLSAWEGRMNQRVQGLETKTDPAMFDALQTVLTRAENGDAAALAEVRKMDPTRLYAALDTQARDYVQNRRANILNPKNGNADDGGPSEDDLLETEVFDKLGISKNAGKGDSDEDKATRYQFLTTYWSATRAKQAEVKRKLNSAEKQQIMRDLLIPFSRTVKDKYVGFIDGSETKRGFEIENVPMADQAQIIAAFRQVNGVDPSPEQIRATYLRAQGYTPQLETP